MLYHLSKDKITPYNQFWEKNWDMPNKKQGVKKK
jgi:hypothetical protein